MLEKDSSTSESSQGGLMLEYRKEVKNFKLSEILNDWEKLKGLINELKTYKESLIRGLGFTERLERLEPKLLTQSILDINLHNQNEHLHTVLDAYNQHVQTNVEEKLEECARKAVVEGELEKKMNKSEINRVIRNITENDKHERGIAMSKIEAFYVNIRKMVQYKVDREDLGEFATIDMVHELNQRLVKMEKADANNRKLNTLLNEEIQDIKNNYKIISSRKGNMSQEGSDGEVTPQEAASGEGELMGDSASSSIKKVNIVDDKLITLHKTFYNERNMETETPSPRAFSPTLSPKFNRFDVKIEDFTEKLKRKSKSPRHYHRKESHEISKGRMERRETSYSPSQRDSSPKSPISPSRHNIVIPERCNIEPNVNKKNIQLIELKLSLALEEINKLRGSPQQIRTSNQDIKSLKEKVRNLEDIPKIHHQLDLDMGRMREAFLEQSKTIEYLEVRLKKLLGMTSRSLSPFKDTSRNNNLSADDVKEELYEHIENFKDELKSNEEEKLRRIINTESMCKSLELNLEMVLKGLKEKENCMITAINQMNDMKYKVKYKLKEVLQSFTTNFDKLYAQFDLMQNEFQKVTDPLESGFQHLYFENESLSRELKRQQALFRKLKQEAEEEMEHLKQQLEYSKFTETECERSKSLDIKIPKLNSTYNSGVNLPTMGSGVNSPRIYNPFITQDVFHSPTQPPTHIQTTSLKNKNIQPLNLSSTTHEHNNNTGRKTISSFTQGKDKKKQEQSKYKHIRRKNPKDIEGEQSSSYLGSKLSVGLQVPHRDSSPHTITGFNTSSQRDNSRTISPSSLMNIRNLNMTGSFFFTSSLTSPLGNKADTISKEEGKQRVKGRDLKLLGENIEGRKRYKVQLNKAINTDIDIIDNK